MANDITPGRRRGEDTPRHGEGNVRWVDEGHPIAYEVLDEGVPGKDSRQRDWTEED
jgi:hypothetical protein